MENPATVTGCGRPGPRSGAVCGFFTPAERDAPPIDGWGRGRTYPVGVAWCRCGHEAGGGGGMVTACGPGQADTRPRGMSWGGLLVKSGRATADGVTGRAGAHEGSRRAQGPRAGTSAPAEGSRLSREQTARCLGGLGGAVVRPRRTGAGRVVEHLESGCPSGGVARAPRVGGTKTAGATPGNQGHGARWGGCSD